MDILRGAAWARAQVAAAGLEGAGVAGVVLRVLQVSTLYKREFSAGVTVPSHWFPDCSF